MILPEWEKFSFFYVYYVIYYQLGGVIFALNYKQPLSLISVGVFLWILWIMIKGKPGGIWHDEKWLWWTGCLLFYFILEAIFRYILQKHPIQFIYIPIVVIVIIAGIEATMGTLQVFGKFRIYHGLFKVSGTFFNPAPFAGFLIASFPFALFLSALQTKHRGLQGISYLGYLAVCLILAIIPATQSRAAYLGLAAGMLVWSFYRYEPIQQLKTLFNTRIKKTLTLSLGIVFLLASLTALFYFKKDSASGRLLIWKSTLQTIKKQPFSGNGFNTLQATFAPAQAAYFASGAGSESEKMLAGSVKWGFNELLQTASESGIIGLVILLMLIALAFMTGIKPSRDRSAYLLMGASKATLAGILIFGCFSYPFYSLPITLLFFTALAFISSLSQRWVIHAVRLNLPIKALVLAGLTSLCIFEPATFAWTVS